MSKNDKKIDKDAVNIGVFISQFICFCVAAIKIILIFGFLLVSYQGAILSNTISSGIGSYNEFSVLCFYMFVGIIISKVSLSIYKTYSLSMSEIDKIAEKIKKDVGV